MNQMNISEMLERQLTWRRWLRDIVLGLILFSCGFVLGGLVVGRIMVTRAVNVGFDSERIGTVLRYTLKLDETQAEQVQQIIDRGLRDLREIRYSVRPRVEEVLNRIQSEVSAVLDEEQKIKWEKRFQKTRARWFPPVPEEADPKTAPSTP